MKKVFITIPWFLPAYKAGGPVQSIANMVSVMQDIEFRIFCGDTDLNSTALDIETGKWIAHNDHTKLWYAKKNDRSDILVDLVAKSRPDVLFIIGIYSWHFNLVPLLFCKVPRKIISVRGMLHPGGLTQKMWKKKMFLAAFRLSGLQKKISFHASDAAEEKHIKDTFGEVNVVKAINFPRRVMLLPPLTKAAGSLSLISIALISPMKNHLLILQALERSMADITYHVAGPVKDMEYWQQCLEQIKKLPSNITIHYHGDFPPSKLEEFLNLGHVFILPSKSENFGHAIFEALSAGKPVITSHFTPWNNLQEHKAGMNVETGVDEIRDGIKLFSSMDNEQYHEWVSGARNYGEKKLNVEEIKRSYLKMFG